MFCSKCGSRLSGGSNFCHSCGAKTVQVSNPVPDVTYYPPPPQAYPGQGVPDVILPQSPTFPNNPSTPELPEAPVPTVQPFTADNSVAAAAVISPPPITPAPFVAESPATEPCDYVADYASEPVDELEDELVELAKLDGDDYDEALSNLEDTGPACGADKVYFGKPAFVFCMVVIGALAAACGVLATLYFGGF